MLADDGRPLGLGDVNGPGGDSRGWQGEAWHGGSHLVAVYRQLGRLRRGRGVQAVYLLNLAAPPSLRKNSTLVSQTSHNIYHWSRLSIICQPSKNTESTSFKLYKLVHLNWTIYSPEYSLFSTSTNIKKAKELLISYQPIIDLPNLYTLWDYTLNFEGL